MNRATPKLNRLFATLALAALVQMMGATSAVAQTPPALNVPQPLDNILRMVYDGLGAKNVLGFSYDDAKIKIPEFAAKFAAFGRDFQKLLGTSAESVKQHIGGALTAGFKSLGLGGNVNPAKTPAGPFDAALKAVESVTSGIDAIRKEVFELLNPLTPPTSPTDAKDTKFCADWLRAKATPVFDKLKGIANFVIPPPIVEWARDFGLAKLAEAGAPFLVLIRFVRGKIKEGVKALILLAMESTVKAMERVDEWLKELYKMLPPPLNAIFPEPAVLIKTIRPFVASALDTIGRATGAIASYLLNAFPTIKQYAKILGDTLVNVADAASAGVSAFLDGTSELMPAKGTKIDPTKVGTTVGKFNQSFEIGADTKSADAPLPKAMKKLMEQIAGAVEGAMRPMLEQVSAVVNFGIGALFNTFRKAITTGLRLIPEAGGIVGGVFNVVTGLALNIFLSTMSAVVMEMSLAILKEEVVGQYTILVDIWTDPESKAKLKRFRQVVDEVFPFFEGARKALHAAKAGFEKGAAALFEGPLMGALLSKLPFGWGGVIQPAVSGALEEAFAPGKVKSGFQLDLAAILRAVMDRLRSFDGKNPLQDFLMRNWPKDADTGLRGALIGGIEKAWDVILGLLNDSGKVGDFLNVGAIRRVVGEFVKSAAPGIGALFAKGLDAVKLCGSGAKLGTPDMATGVTNAVIEIGRAIADDKDNAIQQAVMQDGFDGLISIVAKVVMKPLGELMACRIALPDIGKMFKQAIDEAGDFFSDPTNIDLLKKNGLPAFFALAMKLFRFPIGQFMASGFGDPLLGGEIAETISRVHLEFMKPDFWNGFLGGGFGGVTFKLAGMFQAPIIGWFSRSFPDKDLGQAAAEGFSEAIKPVDGKNSEVTNDMVLKKGLFAFLKPILRKVYRKAVEEFDKGPLGVAQKKLVAFADGVGRFFGPLAELKNVVAKATDAGRATFKVEALKCDTHIQLDDAMKSATNLANCVKDAFVGGDVAKKALDEGRDELVRAAVREFTRVLAPCSSKLASQIDDLTKAATRVGIPLAAEVGSVGKLLACEGGKQFMACATTCATFTRAANGDFGVFVGEVGTCLGKAATGAAFHAAMKLLERSARDLNLSKKIGDIKTLVDKVKLPLVGDFFTVVDKASASALTKFADELALQCAMPCASEKTDDIGKLLEFAKTCIGDAASEAFFEFVRGGLRGTIGLVATDAQKASVELGKFIGSFKAIFPEVARLKGVIKNASQDGRDAFVWMGNECVDQLTRDIKGTIGPVVDCVVKAGQEGLELFAFLSARESIRQALLAVADNIQTGKEQLKALVTIPGIDALSKAVDKVGEAAKKPFAEKAKVCPDKLEQKNMAGTIGVVAKCVEEAVAASVSGAGAAVSDIASGVGAGIDGLKGLFANAGAAVQALWKQVEDKIKEAEALVAKAQEAIAATVDEVNHIQVGSCSPNIDLTDVGTLVDRFVAFGECVANDAAAAAEASLDQASAVVGTVETLGCRPMLNFRDGAAVGPRLEQFAECVAKAAKAKGGGSCGACPACVACAAPSTTPIIPKREALTDLIGAFAGSAIGREVGKATAQLEAVAKAGRAFVDKLAGSLPEPLKTQARSAIDGLVKSFESAGGLGGVLADLLGPAASFVNGVEVMGCKPSVDFKNPSGLAGATHNFVKCIADKAIEFAEGLIDVGTQELNHVEVMGCRPQVDVRDLQSLPKKLGEFASCVAAMAARPANCAACGGCGPCGGDGKRLPSVSISVTLPGGGTQQAGAVALPAALPRSCQEASDKYGINHGVSWGSASAEVQAWWKANNCQTRPAALPRSCQEASDKFGINHGVSWGSAPAEVQAWWKANNCQTRPSAAVTAPGATTPGLVSVGRGLVRDVVPAKAGPHENPVGKSFLHNRGDVIKTLLPEMEGSVLIQGGVHGPAPVFTLTESAIVYHTDAYDHGRCQPPGGGWTKVGTMRRNDNHPWGVYRKRVPAGRFEAAKCSGHTAVFVKRDTGAVPAAPPTPPAPTPGRGRGKPGPGVGGVRR